MASTAATTWQCSSASTAGPAAAAAISERLTFRPLVVAEPVVVTVTLARPALADLVGMLDDVERLDGRTLRFTRPTMPDAYRILRLVTVLCSTPL